MTPRRVTMRIDRRVRSRGRLARIHGILLGVLCLLYLICLSNALIPRAAVTFGQRTAVSTRCSSVLQLASTTPEEDLSTNDESTIQGLVPDFERLNAIHESIQELRRQIPLLLQEPLSDTVAATMYTADTRLLVAQQDNDQGFELASSRQELVLISNALVLATTASLRAGNFLSSSFGSSRNKNATAATAATDTTTATTTPPAVTCRLLVDPSFTAIIVEWQAQLLPKNVVATTAASSSRELSRIQGTSRLQLDALTGRVASHQLLNVQWNDQEQSATVIGQSLSTVRKTFQSLSQSPLLQPFFSGSSPLLSLVGQELFQQLSGASKSNTAATAATDTAGTNAPVLAPLYVTPSLDEWSRRNETTISTKDDSDDSAMANVLEPIDEWATTADAVADGGGGNETRTILPGSQDWARYAAAHKTITQFLETGIPALAGDTQVSLSQLQSYFVPAAKVVALDGSLLLQNADKVANFYQSLTAWRTRSFASWTLERAVVLDWKGQPRIQVDYSTAVNLPGAASTALTVQGRDIYVLSEPTIELDSSDIPTVQIEQVQQQKLKIGDNRNAQDGVWFMRSIATAVETGRFRNNEDSFILDFLKRRNVPKPGEASSPVPKVPAPKPKRLSDKAAANVYRIMTSLHTDLADLFDGSADLLPPGHEYMTDDVMLQGYLGEVLLRGRPAYQQSLGLLLASLRAALKTGRVRAQEPQPAVRVELTAAGNVRVSLTMRLQILPLTGNIPGFDASLFPGSGSLPLKIELVSDYVIDEATGNIAVHNLVESRVNGQLTPGDIVSNWIQKRDPGSTNGEDSWMQTLLDTAQWVRSLNKS